MVERMEALLLEALRRAAMAAHEQRLFRAGKLEGLFASRNGVSGAAAAHALGDGLLEVMRLEEKGKSRVEWMRLTPRGLEFLHRHESPAIPLKELRALLRAGRAGLPAWLADMRQEMNALAARLEWHARAWSHRLNTLQSRVEESLRRAEASPRAPGGTAAWAVDALAYLDRRAAGGAEDCPLPELFAALRQQHAELMLTEFHQELRRLHDRHALKLLPFAGPAEELPEPEYALVEGHAVLYFAAR